MISEILANMPLKDRLKIINEMSFIELLSRLGYRKNEMWNPEEDTKLQILMDFAEEVAQRQMEEVENPS